MSNLELRKGIRNRRDEIKEEIDRITRIRDLRHSKYKKINIGKVKNDLKKRYEFHNFFYKNYDLVKGESNEDN